MSDVNDQPFADLSAAPLPTEKTLRRRKSLVFQPVRFGVFNYRMLRMITKGHH